MIGNKGLWLAVMIYSGMELQGEEIIGLDAY